MSKMDPNNLSNPPIFKDSLSHVLASLEYIDLLIRWAVVRVKMKGLEPDDETRRFCITEDEIEDLVGYGFGQGIWATPDQQPANNLDINWQQWPQMIARMRQEWQQMTIASLKDGKRLLLAELINDFKLNQKEVDLLLLAFAPEIDPRYGRIFAYLQDDLTKRRPTVNLILNLLSASFEEKLTWRHLFAGTAALFQNQLLIRSAPKGMFEPTLLEEYVYLAPNVAEYLLSQPALDDQLSSFAAIVSTRDMKNLSRLNGERLQQLEAIAHEKPLLAFIGGNGVGKREGAVYLAQKKKQNLLEVDLSHFAANETTLLEKMSLVVRDGRLLKAILLLKNWDSILHEHCPPQKLFEILTVYPYIVITTGQENWLSPNRINKRPVLFLHFQAPNYAERLRIWRHHLQQEDIYLPAIANKFRFTPGQIEDVLATASDWAYWQNRPLTTEDLLLAGRSHSNQKLNLLATKIEPHYCWTDIVLPEDTLCQMQEMVNTLRQRPTVYDQWGFQNKIAWGKGLNALFAGESGTGKTMAADIIAGELGLSLYKIDLSAIVSKYIGETEKNLNRIFTEAETSNAVLFFDEADAIFGKRSNVKDSHDRYANIETSYLLQRMEAFDGIVILATNLRANLDQAFIRRLHFIVEFPFPEVSDRERIWQVMFPQKTPISPKVDFRLLSKRFELSGGNIRNIVLAAAFLAAQEQEPVNMHHLLHAARREYQKMGRLIKEQLFQLPAEAATLNGN